MWARSSSKNNVSCDTFDSSHDEYCVTTSAIPLRTGKHPSPCNLVFPLLCSHAVSFHGSVLTDAIMERMWHWRKNASCAEVHNAFPCFSSEPLARIRLARMQNALVESDRSASDLIQRTQRNVPRSLWSNTFYFFRLGRKK